MLSGVQTQPDYQGTHVESARNSEDESALDVDGGPERCCDSSRLETAIDIACKLFSGTLELIRNDQN